MVTTLNDRLENLDKIEVSDKPLIYNCKRLNYSNRRYLTKCYESCDTQCHDCGCVGEGCKCAPLDVAC